MMARLAQKWRWLVGFVVAIASVVSIAISHNAMVSWLAGAWASNIAVAATMTAIITSWLGWLTAHKPDATTVSSIVAAVSALATAVIAIANLGLTRATNRLV